jgi:hypothetical protein
MKASGSFCGAYNTVSLTPPLPYARAAPSKFPSTAAAESAPNAIVERRFNSGVSATLRLSLMALLRNVTICRINFVNLIRAHLAFD